MKRVGCGRAPHPTLASKRPLTGPAANASVGWKAAFPPASLTNRLQPDPGTYLMLPPDRDWHAAPRATEASLSRLVAASPIELPSEYLSFLAHSNGGEGPLALQPCYFQIYSADDVARALEDRRHEEFFPGFVIMGSNGGGEYVGLDVRGSPPWPVVALDMTNIDLDESVLVIAPSFAAFIDLVGKEADAG